MIDEDIRQHVLDELEFEPSIHAANIGVAVEKGIVTLSGHVPTYAEKFEVERIAQRVKGVRGIAEEIEVRLTGEKQHGDDQIAGRAIDIIAWDTTIPEGAVQVKVQKGWVTLTGTVDWHYQRLAAQSAVRKLGGVAGINNLIEVRRHVQTADVRQRIETALRRSAEVEAGTIKVRVADGTVYLDGQVHSWHEREVAERAAWSIEGVSAVEDHLTVG